MRITTMFDILVIPEIILTKNSAVVFVVLVKELLRWYF